METSFIYIISNGQGDFKIGVTKQNPKKRLKQLQTGNPCKLQLIETYKIPSEKAYRLEREAHRAVQSKYAKRGEWFKNANGWDVNCIVDMVCGNYLID